MNYKKLAIGIAFFAISCVIVFSFLFYFKTTEIVGKNPIDTNIFADYGALIGGLTSAVLSLASILLLLQSINDSNKNVTDQLKESRDSSTKQQIEGRFFELVKIHRENRAEIILNKPGSEITFQTLIAEYEEILKVVEPAESRSFFMGYSEGAEEALKEAGFQFEKDENENLRVHIPNERIDDYIMLVKEFLKEGFWNE